MKHIFRSRRSILFSTLIALIVIALPAIIYAASVPTVIAIVPVGSTFYPVGLRLNPVTNQIYVASSWRNYVAVINGATKTASNIVMPRGFVGVAVNSVTNRAYILNGDLTVIDGTTNTILTTMPIPFWSYDLTVDSTNNRIYIVGSDQLLVVDGATNSAITTVQVGRSANSVSVNPLTNRVYVANGDDYNLSVVDTLTNTVIGTIPVGAAPNQVLVVPATNRIYVANALSETVSIINGNNNALITAVPVGQWPLDMTYSAATQQLYVVNEDSNNITVINTLTNTLITTFPLGNTPNGIDINPNTGEIYIASMFTDEVYVLGDIVLDPDVVIQPPVLVSPPEIPISGAEVPLCSDFDGSTNPVVRASLPAGVFGIHCQIIAENRIFTRTAAEVGVPDVLNMGVIHAVDVFSPSNANAAGTQLCLAGPGRMIFLDARAAPRTPQALPSTYSGNYTCSILPSVGTVVLVEGAALENTAPDSPMAVVACKVTILRAVRLRTEPDSSSAIITTLPYQLTLTATAHQGDFYRVIYEDGQGWVHADYVSASDC